MATPSCGGGGAGERMGEGVGERCGRFSFRRQSTRRATRVLVLSPFPSDLLWRAETNAFDVNFNSKHFDRETALQLV